MPPTILASTGDPAEVVARTSRCASSNAICADRNELDHCLSVSPGRIYSFPWFVRRATSNRLCCAGSATQTTPPLTPAQFRGLWQRRGSAVSTEDGAATTMS